MPKPPPVLSHAVRIAGFFALSAVWLVVVHAIGGGLGVLDEGRSTGWPIALAFLSLALATLTSTAVLDEGRWASNGLPGPPIRVLSDTMGGFAAGAVLIGLAVSITALGPAQVAASTSADAKQGMLLGAVLLGMAATLEELLFRGFAFLQLATLGGALGERLAHQLGVDDRTRGQAIGRAVVVISAATVFGFAHQFNHGASGVSTLNTILAGIWLGVVALATRSIWLVSGLHWGWNWAQTALGLPLSGYDDGEPVLPGVARIIDLDLSGPTIWTGGEYGIEGSWAATIVLLLAVPATMRWQQRQGRA